MSAAGVAYRNGDDIDDGILGILMNVISTCAFACTASFIYKRKRTLGGALIGLGSGIILSTAMMLLWNWAITPIYMGYPRSAVAAMLLPVFAPFNLIKSTLNASFTLCSTAACRPHSAEPDLFRSPRKLRPVRA